MHSYKEEGNVKCSPNVNAVFGLSSRNVLNPVALAIRVSSDQQSFTFTEANTVLFSEGKVYLCLPSFAL